MWSACCAHVHVSISVFRFSKLLCSSGGHAQIEHSLLSMTSCVNLCQEYITFAQLQSSLSIYHLQTIKAQNVCGKFFKSCALAVALGPLIWIDLCAEKFSCENNSPCVMFADWKRSRKMMWLVIDLFGISILRKMIAVGETKPLCARNGHQAEFEPAS